MAMSIQTNVASISAQKNLLKAETGLNSSMAKLSSGFRITSASDDAAGLSISANLGSQIRSYNQATRNASDGLSLVQTAEGAMNEIGSILTRLRELSVQSASDGVGNTERLYIQDETNALTTEINRIANASEYNGTALLNSASTSLTFQVGIRNVAANDQISIATVNVNASSLAVNSLSLSSKTTAQAALATLDSAMQTLSQRRSTFGAVGNRLNSVVSTIATASENLSAAQSRVRDVNVAEETSKLARTQVLMQAATSILAQANTQPQLALRLLG
jgi:flagellin